MSDHTDSKQDEALKPCQSFFRPVRIEGWRKGLDGGGWYIKDSRNKIILEVSFDENEELYERPITGGNPAARAIVALINDDSPCASVAAPEGDAWLSLVELAEAALLSLERIDTAKLAALGRDQDAESVGNTRRHLDRLLLEARRVNDK